MIKSKFLNHKGGIYYYTIHEHKLNHFSNNGFAPLKDYLNTVMFDCPDHYFNTGPRSSCLKFTIPAKVFQITGHEISELTRQGLEVNHSRFKSAHSKVQSFLLERDPHTIATEVPIWAKPEEIPSEIINIKDPLTGHIDLLRIEGGNIWVWDYKPNAFKEKYSPTQVYFYSLMLSKRTGTSLSHFRCGYFDSNYAFIFDPSKVNFSQEKLS
ncbi:MAG: PD-(D/E)XK nuclease family protein [Nanoarchaeota archaeon]|nr:PD-(D/E)XK nuclease family protein [Nanoarchaeota archaeon]